MVPATKMQIDKISLNQNEKIDRNKLPEPVFGDNDYSQDDANKRPLNMLEEKIVEITKTM